jgi:DNA-directed RNA polymerase specialized sigma24 family protein
MASQSTGDGATPAGAGGLLFATTHWSVVLAAGQAGSPKSAAALETLCRGYWYPLYAFVRRQGYSPHDAQDLTQAFFACLLEKKYLADVQRDKGKFRSFLLAALKHFLSHERDRARAAKRGGGQTPISLDEEAAEELFLLEPASQASPEAAFDKRWATALLERAFAQVREEFMASGKGLLFERLQTYLADGTSQGDYSAVAAELGMKANAVAVAVHRLRHRYREAVRAEVANTVADPAEIENEMRYLFAALVK